jgi:hypothetical protein
MGSAGAQHNLATSLHWAKGVAKDSTEAYKWMVSHLYPSIGHDQCNNDNMLRS